MRALFTTIVLCASLAALAPDVVADEAGAKKRFAEGLSLFERGSYAAALASFEESYKLSPRPSVLFNIGMCHRALFAYTDAIAAFEKLVAEGGDPKRPQLAAEAETQLHELIGLVGRIEIVGAPDGALVTLDDSEVIRLPLKAPLYVDPGSHSVTVALAGHEAVSVDVRAPAGAVIQVAAALRRLDEKREGPAAPVGKATLGAANDPSPENRAVPPPTVDKGRALRISGVAVGLVGLAGVGVGVGFAVERYMDMREGEKLKDSWNTTGNTADYAKYEELRNKQVPADTKGLAVGFAAGGVLVATGVVLLTAGIARKSAAGDRGRKTVAFAPHPGGIRIDF